MRRKIYYYLQIIPISRLISNWYELFLLLVIKDKERILHLKDGTKFIVRHHLDVLIIKESYGSDEYKISRMRPTTIIDIGANIGDFTILAAKKFPKAKIYSYEPDPETFKMHSANLALNGANNVVASEIAISGKKGKVKFYSHEASGLSSLNKSRIGMKKIEVRADTLKSIFVKNKIIKCDFLKMDCEGAEFEILFSTPRSLFALIKHMAFEYHDSLTKHNSRELVDYLEELGYKVKITPHPHESDIGIIYASL